MSDLVRLAAAKAIYREHQRRLGDKQNLAEALRDPAFFAWWLSGGRYARPRHIQLIADKAAAAIEAGNARLIVCAPPRHAKSTILSETVPAWFLTRWPDKRVILSAYGDTFAETWGMKVRNLLVEHASRLPVKVVRGIDAAAGDWMTTKGGGMLTAGVMGPILGRGADLFIVDDPTKNAQEAYSPVYQQKLRDWYQSTAQTRLQPGGSVVVTMQRWPSADFVSWLLEQRDTGRETWDLVILPAIAEADDALGRAPGEALWPEMWPIDVLERKRLATEDAAFWSAQYQQRPPEASASGRAYHAFSVEHSIEECEFDPNVPITLGCDFNVDPMAWVIGQVWNNVTPAYFNNMTLERRDESSLKRIRILDELFLPESQTQTTTREFIKRCEPWLKKHGRLEVIILGDASGNARNRAADADYRIIEEMLRADGRFIVSVRAHTSNPGVRERVTTVNNALLNAAGERRLKISPKCIELRKDLLGMRWKRDVAGNPVNDLDKSDRMRSHISDALGYLVMGEVKMRSKVGYGSERII